MQPVNNDKNNGDSCVYCCYHQHFCCFYDSTAAGVSVQMDETAHKASYY